MSEPPVVVVVTGQSLAAKAEIPCASAVAAESIAECTVIGRVHLVVSTASDHSPAATATATATESSRGLGTARENGDSLSAAEAISAVQSPAIGPKESAAPEYSPAKVAPGSQTRTRMGLEPEPTPELPLAKDPAWKADSSATKTETASAEPPATTPEEPPESV